MRSPDDPFTNLSNKKCQQNWLTNMQQQPENQARFILSEALVQVRNPLLFIICESAYTHTAYHFSRQESVF